MSKAKDALELIYSTDKARHLCSIKSKCAGCGELHKAFALLRDYITTTEARMNAVPAQSGKTKAEERDDILIHMQMLCTDDMRADACADATEHDLPFQVFRILGGYSEALDRLTKSAARIKELEEQVAAYAAVPIGMQFMNDPGMLERSWPIDFPGENGNYMCVCSMCGEHFIGHKRRLTCRKCDTSALSGARKVEP